MKKIGFSGTLDPITNGHMWVIGEARTMADEVVVLVSHNPFKKPRFSDEERKAIVEQSLAARGWTDVSVMIVRGDYTARAARRHGIDYLIRGLRNTADFDYENLIQQANQDVLQGAKTLFVMPPRDLGSVSSSFVRGLIGPVGWHAHVKKFVPAPAYRALILDWLERDWQSLWRDTDSATKAAHWFSHLTGEAAYGAPARHYHGLDHLVHGLSEIAVWGANSGASADDIDTLKKAFWFHDAVYEPAPSGCSNEEASAQLWLDAGLDARPDDVAALIRATDHLQAGRIAHPLREVMLGADLAILGQPDGVYDDYARAIRMEYAQADDRLYAERRARVLRHFDALAAGGALYADPYFGALYNDAAHTNMAREIASLAG
ncbi:MAG: pantetheine-phosphate adenylyltransferase [Massilia sp.]